MAKETKWSFREELRTGMIPRSFVSLLASKLHMCDVIVTQKKRRLFKVNTSHTDFVTSHSRPLSNDSACHKLWEVYPPILQLKSRSWEWLIGFDLIASDGPKRQGRGQIVTWKRMGFGVVPEESYAFSFPIKVKVKIGSEVCSSFNCLWYLMMGLVFKWDKQL